MNLILIVGIKIVLFKYVIFFFLYVIVWIILRDILFLILDDRNLFCLGGSGVNCFVF